MRRLGNGARQWAVAALIGAGLGLVGAGPVRAQDPSTCGRDPCPDHPASLAEEICAKGAVGEDGQPLATKPLYYAHYRSHWLACEQAPHERVAAGNCTKGDCSTVVYHPIPRYYDDYEDYGAIAGCDD